MRGHVALGFLAILVPSLQYTEAKDSRQKLIPPVILIPGDGGSQIEARLDKPEVVHYICDKKLDQWFDLWLNMELLLPYVIDCWVDNMKLVYNNETRRTSNAPGVETRIPGFGNSTTVEWLDPSHRSPTGYFKDIVNSIIPLGYERGVTVRGAPFDFRKAPHEHDEYFQKLRRLIEETYQQSGQKVILVLHSMGAPMTYYFLNKQSQHWKDRHIESVVSLAGAWGGSIKAVKVYTAGDNLGIYVISSLKVRAEQRSSSSLAFLLPSADIWGSEDILVQTPSKNYSTANLGELFKDLDLPDAYEIYLDTKDLLKNPPPPGVEVHCLHGEGVPTVEKLVYAEGKFPDSPTVVNGEGDGTVNIRSAHRCLEWVGKQKQGVFHKSFKGVDHMEILRNKNVITYFAELIHNVTTKNEKLAKLKTKNLLRLEKKKNKAQNVLQPSEANSVLNRQVVQLENEKSKEKRKLRSDLDDVWKKKEKVHPNSIWALLSQEQSVPGL